MRRMKRVFAITSLLLGLTSSYLWAQIVDGSALLFNAYKTGQPMPVLSVEFPDLDVNIAYEIQKAYTRCSSF